MARFSLCSCSTLYIAAHNEMIMIGSGIGAECGGACGPDDSMWADWRGGVARRCGDGFVVGDGRPRVRGRLCQWLLRPPCPVPHPHQGQPVLRCAIAPLSAALRAPALAHLSGLIANQAMPVARIAETSRGLRGGGHDVQRRVLCSLQHSPRRRRRVDTCRRAWFPIRVKLRWVVVCDHLTISTNVIPAKAHDCPGKLRHSRKRLRGNDDEIVALAAGGRPVQVFQRPYNCWPTGQR